MMVLCKKLCKSIGVVSFMMASSQLYALQENGPDGIEGQVAPPPAQESVDHRPDGESSFGHWLFDGRFTEAGFVGFSPEHVISTGDSIKIQFWGAIDLQLDAEVDASGKVFIPSVGPVQVRGITNAKLQPIISKAVSAVYNKNVSVYARLSEAVPVKVYVTGYVDSPGLYSGHSSDSVLRFVDMAGGVDAVSGSYRNILLKRDSKVIEAYDLYEFLVDGSIAKKQLRDGDVLVVGAARDRVQIRGAVDRAYKYELPATERSLSAMLDMARVSGGATHVRVTKKQDGLESTVYFPLAEAAGVILENGDLVEVLEDTDSLYFSVRIEGEHAGNREITVKRGATLGEVMEQIVPTSWSMTEGIQLFRESVKERQKEMIHSSLTSIESSVLMARSNTSDEATLRQMEADLVMRWTQKAREIEPRGQVLIHENASYEEIGLEPMDVIKVPKRTSIVMVHGDVVAPVASSFKQERTVLDYIELAGGFNQTKDKSKVLVVSANGEFKALSGRELSRHKIAPGDEILVLPQVATKSLQVSKDLTQVIYQIAVSAGTVLKLVL